MGFSRVETNLAPQFIERLYIIHFTCSLSVLLTSLSVVACALHMSLIFISMHVHVLIMFSYACLYVIIGISCHSQ